MSLGEWFFAILGGLVVVYYVGGWILAEVILPLVMLPALLIDKYPILGLVLVAAIITIPVWLLARLFGG